MLNFYLGGELSNKLNKYSYVEALVWQNISKAATGTYSCQTTSLENDSFNTSIAFQIICKYNISLLEKSNVIFKIQLHNSCSWPISAYPQRF
jgi:hypothetical protein